MTVGERIAQLRKQKGITQEELAQALGTTRQAISKWESGKSSPDIDYAIMIGEYFNISMDYLLLGEERPTQKANGDLTHSVNPPHSRETLYIILTIIGICLLFLLPMITSLYQDHLVRIGRPVLTDGYLYLSRWPLKGIVIICFGLIFSGIGGVLRIHYNKQKTE